MLVRFVPHACTTEEDCHDSSLVVMLVMRLYNTCANSGGPEGGLHFDHHFRYPHLGPKIIGFWVWWQLTSVLEAQIGKARQGKARQGKAR